MKKKRNEFKPDKPYSSWLSRLVPTRLQRKSILMWVCCGLVMLMLSILQDVVFSRISIFGTTTDLVPCGIFLFCLLEGAEGGCIFSLTASSLYVFSGSAPGTYTIILITFTATLTALFRQAFLQKGWGTALLCTAFSMVIYELATFGMGHIMGLVSLSRLGSFLITAGISSLAALILYPICLSIGSIGGHIWKE